MILGKHYIIIALVFSKEIKKYIYVFHVLSFFRSSTSVCKLTLNTQEYFLNNIYNFGAFAQVFPTTDSTEGTHSKGEPPYYFL